MAELLNIKQLSVLLGVSERWIYQLKRLAIITTCDQHGVLFDRESCKRAYLDYKLRALKAKGLV
jgi:hypothetical protein